MTREDALNTDIPLLFISFPSAKDTTYNQRYPGKQITYTVFKYIYIYRGKK
jgi:all-trans-retinol 13,14-reductase